MGLDFAFSKAAYKNGPGIEEHNLELKARRAGGGEGGLG
jgi:hypothetical protein